MRRLVIIILAAIFLPLGNTHGVYNEYSDTAYCTDRLTCLHEIGHALDDKSGWISDSEEYRFALSMYLLDANYDELYIQITYTLMTTKQEQMHEVYAWFFAYADGKIENIPPKLQPFYDQELVDKYVNLADNRFLLLWDNELAEITNPIMKR